MLDNPNEYLHHLEWNDELAVAVSKGQLLDVELVSNLSLYCFNSPNLIYGYPLKIMTSKEFQFLDELNRFIQMTTDSGLITKWLKGNSFGSVVSNKQPLHNYVEVELESAAAFLVMYFFIMLLVLAAAIVEKITFHKVQLPNVGPIWKYIGMLVDPHRYFLLGDLYTKPVKNNSKIRKRVEHKTVVVSKVKSRRCLVPKILVEPYNFENGE